MKIENYNQLIELIKTNHELIIDLNNLNNHDYIRDILPNGKNLSTLTQDDLNLIFSHINSTPRQSLAGKTPYEAFSFFYGTEILDKLNIQKIEKDMVTLQPYLLKLK